MRVVKIKKNNEQKLKNDKTKNNLEKINIKNQKLRKKLQKIGKSEKKIKKLREQKLINRKNEKLKYNEKKGKK